MTLGRLLASPALAQLAGSRLLRTAPRNAQGAAQAILTLSTPDPMIRASTPLAVSHPAHPGMRRALGRFRFWRTERANSDTCGRRLLHQALPPDRARQRL